MKNLSSIEEYRQFTTPAEFHKAINMLRGIVAGITSNNSVSTDEVKELANWCSLHANLRHRHPFSEIIPVIESSLEDGVIDDDEAQNILWLCNNFVDDAKFYDLTTSTIQFLNGFIHGIMADGKLSDDELYCLRLWLNNNEFLCGTYPFDEIVSILTSILADGVIKQDEREFLKAFFSNIIEFKESLNLNENDFIALREKYSVRGICSMCPDIQFDGRIFCFTGESYKGTRADIASQIEAIGGIYRNNISNKTDYLIVGNAGNPCWAFSCYGRKIEEAMNMRKLGGKIVIVNETDFWDAVMELK